LWLRLRYKLYVKRFKIHYMIILFFANFFLIDRGRLLRVICQLDVVLKWSRKLIQK
jgi:hypothetical protein